MAKKKKLNTVDLNRFSAKSVSEESKLIRVKVLIVCEGEKTEPNYFRSFSQIANGSGYVYDITTEGGGINTLWVVDKAAELKKKAESIGQPYDTVWAVFDKDSFLDQNFDNAVAKARQLGIGCAWSNEAFELWYVLHFDSRCTAMSRKGVYLVRLNSDYVRGNELDLQQLFHITDMSELVTEESAVVEQKVAAAQYMLKQSTPPCIEIGNNARNLISADSSIIAVANCQRTPSSNSIACRLPRNWNSLRKVRLQSVNLTERMPAT